jgi:hypothetical protein
VEIKGSTYSIQPNNVGCNAGYCVHHGTLRAKFIADLEIKPITSTEHKKLGVVTAILDVRKSGNGQALLVKVEDGDAPEWHARGKVVKKHREMVHQFELEAAEPKDRPALAARLRRETKIAGVTHMTKDVVYDSWDKKTFHMPLQWILSKGNSGKHWQYNQMPISRTRGPTQRTYSTP